MNKPAYKKKNPKRNLPYEIGLIGETAVQNTFPVDNSPLFEEGHTNNYQIPSKKQTLSDLKKDLKEIGITIDTQTKDILKDTMRGLDDIKAGIKEKYGKFEILGHGESRNGFLVNHIKPDFVAIANKKLIIVEVKNTKNIVKSDYFQASFYNSVTKNHGISILKTRNERTIKTIVPKLINIPSETLLVYPRLKQFKKITNTLQLDDKIIKNIWIAKQLGISGKSPKTDCDSKCPHHKHKPLPDDNLEPATPLPLIYAKGAIEQNSDLDAHYLKRYIMSNELNINRLIFSGFNSIRFSKINSSDKTSSIKKMRELFLNEIMERTGFTKQDLLKMKLHQTTNPSLYNDNIEKEMYDEFTPWKKLLGKNFKKIPNIAKSKSSSSYTLPKNSKKYVNQSWRKW